ARKSDCTYCTCLIHTRYCCFFFSSRRRHTRFSRDWSSDVCSSDLESLGGTQRAGKEAAYDADRDRQLECGRPGEGDVAQRRAERGYREDLPTAPRIRLPAPVDLAKDVAEAVRREQ